MKRKIIPKLFLSIILMFVVFMSICEAVSEDISGGIVRLHIIANSNSEEDQEVKLKVRDKIIEYAKGYDDIDIDFAEEHKDEIKKIADKTLSENGFLYESYIDTGRFNFPTKTYENITLPKGEYDAVKIVLGKGGGENWWCVMFPPLCFTESVKGELSESDEQKLRRTMSDAEYEIISDEKIEFKPAFRALELWAEIKEKYKKSYNGLLYFENDCGIF